jgi:Neuraminidase (sialidase)
LNQDAVKYKTNTVLQKTSVTVTPESTTGYWEAEIVENDNMDGTARYIFDFGDRSYSAKVPDEASKRFWDLEELQVVE